eukprot:CAMPEP_0117007708 /NCGR_PEP_ID=MMETSP0472-20121206/7494_1 /TAXON_ID=693140 ORGANISM="Tiarina fusus, Strain LIS" /NCGR_SAMPLE_ID=MMETSP0472 /ASSEMBLY_ACC=CAM_ASM_000603 /LENGTH=343 /DNA_ID=CAMNT_0004709559 /DNA_START=45 /DNA_END=1076 /DNA_ORIENTATION=+
MMMPHMTSSYQGPPIMANAPKRSAHKTKLPRDFVPGTYTVICGRGKLCSASPGNKHLRSLVNSYLTPYSLAKNKAEKSSIVSAIVDRVREASPVGAFIKQEDNGEWWEVDDSFAREKIGCIFRDILHKQYRSSTKAKQARKKAQEGSEDSTTKKICGALQHSAKARGGSRSLEQEVSLNKRFNSAHTSLYYQNVALAKFPSLYSTSNKMADSSPRGQVSLDPLPLTEQPAIASHFNNVQEMNGKHQPTGEQSHLQEYMKSNFATIPNGAGLRRQRFDIIVQKQDDRLVTRSLTHQSSSFCTQSADIRRKAHSLLQDAMGVVDGGRGGVYDDDFPDDLSDIFDD